MRMIVVALFDVKAGQFQQPLFVQTIGIGTRAVADAVNGGDRSELVARHPEDFRLYELGLFDTDSGVFIGAEGGIPKLVCEVVSLKTV